MKERDRRTRKQSSIHQLPVRLTILQRIKSLLLCCEDQHGARPSIAAVGDSMEVDELTDFEEEHEDLIKQPAGREAERSEERFDSRIDSCSLTIAISEC